MTFFFVNILLTYFGRATMPEQKASKHAGCRGVLKNSGAGRAFSGFFAPELQAAPHKGWTTFHGQFGHGSGVSAYSVIKVRAFGKFSQEDIYIVIIIIKINHLSILGYLRMLFRPFTPEFFSKPVTTRATARAWVRPNFRVVRPNLFLYPSQASKYAGLTSGIACARIMLK